MSYDLRLIAYSPNGARKGALPVPQDVQVAMAFGDVGALSLSYPANGPKVSHLAGPAEVAVEYSHDDGLTWTEPSDARFVMLERSSDPLDAVPLANFGGPSYIWLLSKVRVLPEGKLDTEGKRAFLTKNPGAIVRTLAQEAQARGAMAGFDVSTFDEDHDSNGMPWPKVITLKYEPGLDYLKIILNLHDQGLVDFTMVGRSLRLYVSDTYMGGTSDATLMRGRDLIEAPQKGSLAGLANFVYLLGDEGKSFSRTGAGIAPWGRWEDFLTQGGVSDTGTMTVLTDSALSLGAAERVEQTYGLSFAKAKHVPFRAYRLGQYVNVHMGAGAVPLRLRQITLTRDSKGVVGGNVVLNDRFLENEVKQARRVQGITGGATNDAGSGGRPAPVNPVDKLAPKAPTALTYTTDAYLDNAGKVWALATLDWLPPTLNTDNTALTDLSGYRVYWRLQGSGGPNDWASSTVTEDAHAAISGLLPNTNYQFALKALDNSGNASPMSAIFGVVTANDAVAPGKPSAPVATAYLGQIMLSWNGLLATGAAVPLDLARAEFQLSTVANFATYTVVSSSATKGPASTVATGLTYGQTYYARMVLIDTAGNVSAPSDSATAVPVKMGGIDLGTGVVGFDQLAFKQNGNSVPDGTLESADYRDHLTAGGFVGTGWSFLSDAANSISGVWALRAIGATGAGTDRVVSLLGSRGVPVPGQALSAPTAIKVSPGEKWLFRCMAKGTTNGSIRVVWWVYDGTGAFLTWATSPNYVGGALGTFSTALTMPNKAAYAVPTLQMDSTVTSGTSYFDDIEIRPIIGTALIEDAAITNAKIASLSADKITAGLMAAAITLSGRIATALTGARMEMNDTGLVSYDASGNLKTSIPGNGGDNLLTGTIKTGLSGARVEIAAAGANGGVARFYSNHVSETAPGTVSTWVQGNAPAANAALYLVSPQRGTYKQCTLVLQSSDSDGRASAGLYLENGDFQIFSSADYGGSQYGGINFWNTSNNSNWGRIMRYGSGVRLHSDYGDAMVSSAYTAWIMGSVVRIQGGTIHAGGGLFLQDTWARGISSAAAVGIGSDGLLYHITSSARYKLDIQDAHELGWEGIRDGLRPRTFIDRREWEENGESADGLTRHLGLIAEEVALIPGLGDLIVPRDEEGRPNEVRYDRVALALIPWLHAIEARLTALELSA